MELTEKDIRTLGFILSLLKEKTTDEETINALDKVLETILEAKILENNKDTNNINLIDIVELYINKKIEELKDMDPDIAAKLASNADSWLYIGGTAKAILGSKKMENIFKEVIKSNPYTGGINKSGTWTQQNITYGNPGQITSSFTTHIYNKHIKIAGRTMKF